MLRRTWPKLRLNTTWQIEESKNIVMTMKQNRRHSLSANLMKLIQSVPLPPKVSFHYKWLMPVRKWLLMTIHIIGMQILLSRWHLNSTKSNLNINLMLHHSTPRAQDLRRTWTQLHSLTRTLRTSGRSMSFQIKKPRKIAWLVNSTTIWPRLIDLISSWLNVKQPDVNNQIYWNST